MWNITTSYNGYRKLMVDGNEALVNMNNILYAIADDDDDGTVLHFTCGAKLVVEESMDSIESSLML